MKTYSITHNLGRANLCTPDLDLVVQQVNALTASNGDSINRDAVERESRAFCPPALLAHIEIVETIHADE